jgi:PAS domain S-box-containing protein
MIDFFKTLFSSAGFMPHGHCYFWNPGVLWLHILSDAFIALAYYSIPFTLVYFIRKRKDLPFNWMFLCFAVFIIACGTTHLLEILVIWHPIYWMQGVVKAITALVSVPTAILLVKLLPQALTLPSPAALRTANVKLEREITERQRAEATIRRMNDVLEQRVAERTRQLEIINESLIQEALERRRAEQKSRENEKLPQAIIDNSLAVIYVKDLSGRYLLVNRRFTEIFHLGEETIIGRNDHDLFKQEAADAFRAMDVRVAAANCALTEEETAPQDDGLHTYVSVKSPLWDDDGKPYAVFGVSTDITERKQAEERLKTSLKEVNDLKAALDEHAIVAITDPQGKITYVNDKFCAISKYSREELIGQDHRLINSGYHPKTFIRDLWTTIARGKVWHGEIKNKAKDDSFYWVDTTIVPFLNEDDKPRQYVAIRADITARKMAAAEIVQLNAELEARVAGRTAELEAANQELEAFSYSVSHDLRAPLRAINGFAEIVLKDFGPQLPEEAQGFLLRVRNGGRRMGELIDDLLAFSRLSRQAVDRQSVNTARMVQEALDELKPQREGRAIELGVGELPACQADPVLLKQVWVNLLSNAIKYTRDRNPAIVEAGCVRQNGEDIYFVRDNGVGFDMKYVDKLFGVFQRLHPSEEFEGTGVGLAIVQRIIRRHGGRVWAEAKVGGGATFHFTLEGEKKT